MDTIPLMLLALHLLALGVATIIFLGMIVLQRRARAVQPMAPAGDTLLSTNPVRTRRPAVWLAIRSSNPKAVQAALGVSYPAPCPWTEGITGEHEFFIGPPVNGWIVVTGSGLPRPGHDVDRCFHFLIQLSRVLSHIQFFVADPVSHHHAWVQVENGAVKRAYAWTGETVWNQGTKSLAEMELNMKCFGYGEAAGTDAAATERNAAINVAKVPLLATRWSIAPMAIDGNLQSPADGIAGKSSFLCRIRLRRRGACRKVRRKEKGNPCHSALNWNSKSIPRSSRSRTARR